MAGRLVFTGARAERVFASGAMERRKVMSCIRIGMHDNPERPSYVEAQYQALASLSVPVVGTSRRD